jgi:hypothetical protein
VIIFVEYFSPIPYICVLFPILSKVRVEAAKAVKVVVYTMHEKAGTQAVKDASFPRIFKLTGKLMVDSQPGARSAAQELALKLHTVLI